MLGTNIPWPNCGEIDIIEAINGLPDNQFALHTTDGTVISRCCVQCSLFSPFVGCFLSSPNSAQTGNILQTNCSTGAGCVVQETKPNSFGSGFAKNGGGVVATQLDTSGIYMWFWPVSAQFW